jgi:hypothetical protein
VSALRLSTPEGIRFIDQGPQRYVKARGSLPHGALARPLPAITPKLREKWRSDARRQRARAAA